MPLKKPFKYYAIRIADTVVFRRTVSQLQKVRSILYKPRSEFRLEQVTYIGGKAVGCMPYTVWSTHHMTKILPGQCIQIPRETYRALDPYIQKEP